MFYITITEHIAQAMGISDYTHHGDNKEGYTWNYQKSIS